MQKFCVPISKFPPALSSEFFILFETIKKSFHAKLNFLSSLIILQAYFKSESWKTLPIILPNFTVDPITNEVSGRNDLELTRNHLEKRVDRQFKTQIWSFRFTKTVSKNICRMKFKSNSTNFWPKQNENIMPVKKRVRMWKKISKY